MFEDGFGNSRVTGLKEISLPEPVSMAPETWGWWILAGVVLVWVAYFGYQFYRHWRLNRYRSLALAELATIEEQWARGEVGGLSGVPVLLKRTAMHALGREGVADLTGSKWLTFLDKTGKTTAFSQGAGQVLPALAYGKTETIDNETVSALFLLVREWIKGHDKRNNV